MYNFSIPQEFLDQSKLKANKSALQSLKIMSKVEWLTYKEQFKKLKKDLLAS